jgi:hypothetical protein
MLESQFVDFLEHIDVSRIITILRWDVKTDLRILATQV